MESQRSEVKECFTHATTRHNSKQSNIQHPSSPELSIFLFSVVPNFREHIFIARKSISPLFKNIIAHIYKIMKKNRIMWCDPRLRPNFCKMARGPKSLATPDLNLGKVVTSTGSTTSRRHQFENESSFLRRRLVQGDKTRFWTYFLPITTRLNPFQAIPVQRNPSKPSKTHSKPIVSF